MLKEYPSVHTFSIQSAFKYDYEVNEVKDAINAINQSDTFPAQKIDKEKVLELIDRYAKAYETNVLMHAALINRVSKYVPSRRLRKLHIGLFGYNRRLKGESLPRAITFTSTLYSLGCPPELFGLEALNEQDLAFVRDSIINFDEDILESLRYFNPSSPCVSQELAQWIKKYFPHYSTDERHLKVTNYIIEKVEQHQHHDLDALILQAASFRRFLG